MKDRHLVVASALHSRFALFTEHFALHSQNLTQSQQVLRTKVSEAVARPPLTFTSSRATPPKETDSSDATTSLALPFFSLEKVHFRGVAIGLAANFGSGSKGLVSISMKVRRFGSRLENCVNRSGWPLAMASRA